MTLEDRVALLEHDLTEIREVLEQHARDHELASANITRVLKSHSQSQNRSQGKTTTTRQNGNGQRVWNWSPDKIKWTQDTGFKGPYEKSDDANNVEFKAMLKDLQDHQGKLNRDGRFYWAFNDGKTVGRTLPK